MTYKARFAPSPTGHLHIGNARSAVLNWTYIKRKGGKFILRFDDTDLERSKSEFEQSIKDHLKWLGISWSKTFNQSNRQSIYQEKISKLKNSNRIYPCFESAEELSLKRKNQLSLGKPPIYDRSALKLTEAQIESNLSQGKNPHWRFRLEDKIIKWDDLIKGEVIFDSKNLSDPILIREDNSLLYHLPSVIDDIEENITDIIRGEDHISNTAFHIQIFEALGSIIPNFGHHSLLTDTKGKGFSKRVGSLSIKNLIDQGFESITIVNYLLSIGTSRNFSKEKNYDSLINNFDINFLSTSSPKFLINELKMLNKDILQSYDFSEIKNRFENINIKNPTEQFWNFVKNNIDYFLDSRDWWEIINSEKVYVTENKDYLKIAAALLPEDPYNINTWAEWTNKIKEKTSKKGKDLFMPLRLALTGKESGPELKYLIPLLKKDKILKKFGQ